MEGGDPPVAQEMNIFKASPLRRPPPAPQGRAFENVHFEGRVGVRRTSFSALWAQALGFQPLFVYYSGISVLIRPLI